MEILESAKKLGEMIKETGVYDRLMTSQEKLMKDKESVELMQEFDSVRMEYTNAVDTKDNVAIEGLVSTMKEVEDKIQKNPVTNDFINISTEYGKLINDINNNITSGITGKDTSELGGCGSGCGSDCGTEDDSCGSGCGCG